MFGIVLWNKKLELQTLILIFPVISNQVLYYMLLPNMIDCFLVWRDDPKIQAIRDHAFPPKAEVDASEAPSTTLPAKIKERSISSLVETPKMATQTTLTGRRTKAARRTITSQTFSLGKLPNKSEDRYQMAEKASALKSTKMTTSANKKQVVLKCYQHIIHMQVLCQFSYSNYTSIPNRTL